MLPPLELRRQHRELQRQVELLSCTRIFLMSSATSWQSNTIKNSILHSIEKELEKRSKELENVQLELQQSQQQSYP